MQLSMGLLSTGTQPCGIWFLVSCLALIHVVHFRSDCLPFCEKKWIICASQICCQTFLMKARKKK